MKLGVMIEGQEGLTWERWRRIARATEDLGFESLWRSDHFHPFMSPPDRPALETWVSLVAVALETRRIRFGVLVCPVTFRHPSLVARMAAQVDQLSGGRLVPGVGAGWNQREHEAFGIPFPPVGVRMRMLEEAVQVMRLLWSSGPASFRGRYYQLQEAVCYPKPAQSPMPLLVGGSGERRALRIVAKYADEWNTVGVNAEGYRAKRAVLEQHCAAVGRDPAQIARSLMTGFIIGRNQSELTERSQRIAQAMGRFRLLQQSGNNLDQVVSTLRGQGWLIGTPAQLVEQIKELEEAGLQRVMLQHLDQEDFGALELVASAVLPQVQ